MRCIWIIYWIIIDEPTKVYFIFNGEKVKAMFSQNRFDKNINVHLNTFKLPSAFRIRGQNASFRPYIFIKSLILCKIIAWVLSSSQLFLPNARKSSQRQRLWHRFSSQNNRFYIFSCSVRINSSSLPLYQRWNWKFSQAFYRFLFLQDKSLLV